MGRDYSRVRTAWEEETVRDRNSPADLDRMPVCGARLLCLFFTPDRRRLGPIGQAQQASPLTSLQTTAEGSGIQVHVDVRGRRQVHEGGRRGLAERLSTRRTGRRTRAATMPLAVVGAGLKDGEPGAVRASDRQAARPHPGQHPRRRGGGQGIGADAAARVRAGPARRLAADDGVPHHADLQRRRQREDSP